MEMIQTKICPFCGEDIKISAIKCRYCGSMLNKNTIPLNPAQSGKTETYLSPGMRLGDYEIVRLIGEGGMGVVYETIYHGLGEPVKRAIKTVPDVVSKDPRSLKRLQKEVLIATSLSHPNIVRVYSLEQYQDIHFITMEYIEGYDFREYLDQKGGKISVEDTVEVLNGVAEALDYAHGLEKPIIHRDLKPQNLIYDIHSKQLKIVDFGIAAEITDSVTTLTQTKLGTSGSPRYMCYEQYMGEEPAIHMDSYAFGIIIYEALNGEPPFVRGDLLAQHEKKEIPSIETISKAKMDVLRKGLTKSIEDRYDVLNEFLDQIREGGTVVESNIIESIKWDLDQKREELEYNDYLRYRNKILTSSISIIRKEAKNNAIAQNFLGECYSIGLAISRNVDEALKWFNKAADQGNANAQYNLGNLYYFSNEKKKAIKWYLKAGEQGSAEAQEMLGRLYEKGEGIDENKEEAVRWYRKAVNKNYTSSLFNLGICYFNGSGVPKDNDEAMELFIKAAKQGYDPAKVVLATSYKNVNYLYKNEIDKWYQEFIDQED